MNAIVDHTPTTTRRFSLKSLFMNSVFTRMFLGRSAKTHGGQRDMYAALGYPEDIDLKDLLHMFHRGGVAHRVVKSLPENIWSYPPTVWSDKNVKTDTWQDKFEETARKYNLWSVMMRLDMMMRLGRYAILVFGTGTKLDTPWSEKEKGKLYYMQPYTDVSITVTSWDDNPMSERYGLPVMYQITPGEFLTNTKGVDKQDPRTTIDVHFSRVVHVANNTLESDIYGTPVLFPIYNHLIDLLKVVGGGAEAHWLVSNRGLQVDIDKEMDMDPEDEEALAKEIDEYENKLRRVIRTRGVKVNPLGEGASQPKEAFDVILSCISGTTGIPKRVLTGAEAGQMASSQDKAAWAERIAEYQALVGWPILLLPVILKLVEFGVLPAVDIKKLAHEWPEPYQMNPLERSLTSSQTSRAISNIARAMRDAPQLLGLTEGRRVIGMSTKEQIYDVGPEDLPKGEQLLPPPPPKPGTAPGKPGNTKQGVADPAGPSAVDPTRETSGGVEAE